MIDAARTSVGSCQDYFPLIHFKMIHKRVIEIEQITRDLDDHDAIFFFERESATDLLNIFDCIGVNIPGEVKVISVDGTFEGPNTTTQACIR